jgi:streptogramin lyase
MTANGTLRGFSTGLALVAGLMVPTAGWANIILAVDDLSNSTVNFFDGTTGALIHQTAVPLVSGNPSGPNGLTFGPDGLLYLADFTNSVIDRFNPSTGNFAGTFVTTGSGLSALNGPSGLVFGPNGNLYVGNFGTGGNSYINEYGGPGSGTPGAFVTQFVVPGFGPPGGLFDPGGMRFHGGNLFVADSSNAEIAKFDGTTGAYTQFVPPGNPPSPISNPQDVVFDALGNLYVTDENTSEVYKYGPTGTYLGAFVTSAEGLAQPVGETIGPDGNLYVVDGRGRVAVFDGMTGAAMTDFVPIGGDLTNPQSLAFGSIGSSTPEPSTFALIAIGILGLVCYRRPRHALKP